ncbi:hypothetical protein AVEN_56203-1 [Araneus ventricosus]|uniref:Reverse transcriptase domain-containing protein n=1 Tax=Araneus ventricosus TaxID=182803 RepID=A0A4Y2P4R8_ARAVE|nr:hypothetical protein AVEN_56203-1 [Araneus ventricosus]
MSEDLEDSPAVISPPPSFKPEKANKYKNIHLSQILNHLSSSVHGSLYVDDLQISGQGCNMHLIERQLQNAVNRLGVTRMDASSLLRKVGASIFAGNETFTYIL